jgi:UTP--glucose-1-phosphate uridylyltransferase
MKRVRKAVVTAAGRGTRQYPASSAVDKVMFPLVDRDGLTKPIIQMIGEEAIAAGIEEICIVTQPNEAGKYREYFRGISEKLLPGFKGMEWALEQSRRLEHFRQILSFVSQDSPEGFGHAVWCARKWVGDEPFLLLLGDHIYLSDNDEGCASQMTRAWSEGEYSAVTAVVPVRENQLSQVGIIRGRAMEQNPRCYEALKIIEKPSVDLARAELQTPGLPEGTWLGHFGMHVFSPAIFEVLERNIRENVRERGEIQLTTAQERLRNEYGGYVALHTLGHRYDTGIPYGLMETQLALALNSVHRKQIITFIIGELDRGGSPPRKGPQAV